MMQRTFITLLAFLVCGSVLASGYGSLEELMNDMNRRQVEAIQAYIAENPDAEDVAEARERLVYGLMALEDHAGALDLLAGEYERLPEDKDDLDLGTAFGEIVVPMLQLYRMAGRMEDAAALITRVRQDFQDHPMSAAIEEALDDFSRMLDVPGVGDPFALTFTALDGREVDLAAMTGKVVLVDFWATWCVPCLKSMPGVKNLYRTYHEKGFEVVGVSLDDDRERLEDYLEKEDIAWPQHFDGNGWENEWAMKYGIQSIPATFLIGPDGTIIAVNPPAPELEAALASLLGGAEAGP